jgi:hypothetical protein
MPMKYLDEGFGNFKWVMELFLEWLLNNFSLLPFSWSSFMLSIRQH